MLKQTIKKIYFISGLIFLLLAIIGIILPVFPTTPFALIAIFFFDKSSKKFHAWCLKIPVFGEGINDWNKHKIIRKKAKYQASFLIFLSGIYLYLKEDLVLWVKVLAWTIMVSIITFIITRSSKEQ